MTTVQELIVDAYGCSGNLSDLARFKTMLRDAADCVGANIVETVHHSFVPHGLTVCAILKESHLVVSTWPEHELVIANIFLCNEKMDGRKCWAILEKELKPKQVVSHLVPHRVFRMQQKLTG